MWYPQRTVKKLLVVLVCVIVLTIPALSDWVEPDPEFVYARLQCTNREADSWRIWTNYFPDNPPWHHDYPAADEFVIGLIHELTGIRESTQ